jgi:hypothetical protein
MNPGIKMTEFGPLPAARDFRPPPGRVRFGTGNPDSTPDGGFFPGDFNAEPSPAEVGS